MRPIQLSMTAFGPYAGNQTLDFRELKASRLFLIHGPTGSGKTTILDAMCFALYGACSGGDRDTRQVRSDHADPAVLTDVTFDFRLGSREYRVYRRPEQQRPKKRGGGTTMTRPEAILYRLSGNGEDTAIATQWQHVTEEVERLLGFRCDQFRQVVMLPQGEFRKLLLADSKERQAILEVLFRTELYRCIEEALKLAAKEVENSRAKTKDYLDVVLKQADVESLDQLSEQLQAAQAKLSVTQAELTRLRTLEKEARERFVHGREVSEKFRELKSAEEKFRGLERSVKQNDERRGTLAAARYAANLLAGERALEARSKEAQEATDKLRELRLALTEATTAKETAEKRLADEKDRREVLEEFRDHITRLESFTAKVNELQKVSQRAVAAGTELNQRTLQLDSAKKSLVDLQEQLTGIASAKDAVEKVAAQAELLQMRLKELEKACKQKEQLCRLSEDQSAAQEELAHISTQVSSTEANLARALEEHKSLEAAWIQGQAAILAQGLVSGVPCPVCGSLEHPTPAVSEKPLPSEMTLKTKATAVENIRRDLERVRTEKLSLESRIGRVQDSEKMLRENLGDFAEKDLTALQRDFEVAKKDLDKAVAAAREREALAQRIQTVSQDALKVEQSLEALESKKNESLLNLQHTEAEVSALKKVIPEEYQAMAALVRSKEAAQKRVQSLVEALENERRNLTQANEQLAECRAAVEAAQDTADLASQRSLNERQEFDASLKEVGFRDVGEFKAAKRTPAEIQRMEKEIQDFDRMLISSADRLKRAEAAVQSLEEPDMESLQAAASKAAEEFQTTVRQEAAILEKLKSLESSLGDYTRESKELERLDKEYAIVGRISEVATGQNSDRISFHRFVLAALLDDVLSAASARLRIMSNGRFLLQRATKITDRRSLSGLDLEVHDTYTGTERPVSTLSGGESFLASLSLALGLADTVQAYAGGIHLDTMFIDEGFGSLDPEALDLALRALFDLQRDGRLVGIISHVPDLKERLDVRLEVRGDRRGSTARFVAG
jgi:DNA repair protein SbcC/Rad50